MGKHYLAKFWPLILVAKGRRAVRRFHLPPYIDGSCRREPDLESEYPSISAVCHGQFFAPRLRKGDNVVYLARKGSYEGLPRHWRLVAILTVIEECESHAAAAEWYRQKRLPVPSNCMVKNNDPKPLRQTMGAPAGYRCGGGTLRNWDAHYQLRAKKWPQFLICRTWRKNLDSPPVITDRMATKLLNSTKRARARACIELSHEELSRFKKVFSKTSIQPGRAFDGFRRHR